MTEEARVLMTNSKEWLVDQIILERQSYQRELRAKIEFNQELMRRLNELTAFVKGWVG